MQTVYSDTFSGKNSIVKLLYLLSHTDMGISAVTRIYRLQHFFENGDTRMFSPAHAVMKCLAILRYVYITSTPQFKNSSVHKSLLFQQIAFAAICSLCENWSGICRLGVQGDSSDALMKLVLLKRMPLRTQSALRGEGCWSRTIVPIAPVPHTVCWTLVLNQCPTLYNLTLLQTRVQENLAGHMVYQGAPTQV